MSPKYTYLYAKAKQILIQSNEKSGHESGYYMRNVLRMKRIAHVAANRRNLAADLVEELMYDNELRFGHGGQELRPMHLQTADMRMPAYKAKNWDLYAVCFLGVSGLVGSAWFAGRWLWMFRAGNGAGVHRMRRRLNDNPFFTTIVSSVLCFRSLKTDCIIPHKTFL